MTKRVGSFKLDANFEAQPGFTILFGASGAGKTTLLDCIAGLGKPDAGRIAIGGACAFDSELGTNVSAQGRKFGYVFQDLALFPHLTAEENIRYGLARLPGEEQASRCSGMLQAFRIEHLRRRRPGEISGGERQRVALARTLVTDPRVLLLDEPLAALDGPVKAALIADLRAWSQAHRVPILYVTHSREEVFALGEQVVVLDQGKVIAQGSPHEVMTAPRIETVAQLAGFENILDAEVESIHEDRGTMTCRLSARVDLETPLIRAAVGTKLRVGIRAGDILLATCAPVGLSARNIIHGRIVALIQRDVIMMARVNCGVEMEVQLTLAARDSLGLTEGKEVWLVVKTHSCHLLAE